jgi:hypothetical protein
MTTHTLMLALLSLDSYNRGSFSEIKWSDASDGETPGVGAPRKIGGATFIEDYVRKTYLDGKSLGKNNWGQPPV